MKSCFANNKRLKILYAVGFLLLLAAAFLGILLGGTPLSVSGILSAFSKGLSSTAEGKIFLYVRLPRTAASLICGAALSVSGAVIQGVLANRLASPSIIGVNSGAGLAVTLCTAFGIYGGLRLSLFAFCGAFAAVMAVSLLARRIGASRGTLILLGVAVNSLLNAFSDAIVTFIPEVGVMSNDFKVGDFSAVTYGRLFPSAALIFVSLAILFTLTNELDVLTLGDDTARALGMNTSLYRTVFLMLAAVLAGCAVSLAGLLSFVGLIVPHAVRRLAGSKSSQLLPLSALFGAAFVCLCDTASRTVFSPYEIPVGIIMAFLGAPFFVFILIKGKGGHFNA
ncbi:MAG: iron ABC transporter permease [Firmicutes bacterium]|nr:iron ABC transporter permease [Bacillota bacterium]